MLGYADSSGSGAVVALAGVLIIAGVARWCSSTADGLLASMVVATVIALWSRYGPSATAASEICKYAVGMGVGWLSARLVAIWRASNVARTGPN
jgi:hypothetical protein